VACAGLTDRIALPRNGQPNDGVVRRTGQVEAEVIDVARCRDVRSEKCRCRTGEEDIADALHTAGQIVHRRRRTEGVVPILEAIGQATAIHRPDRVDVACRQTAARANVFLEHYR
jgi:hypothetical protein